MSEPPLPSLGPDPDSVTPPPLPPSADDLQFTTAEPQAPSPGVAAPAGPTCAGCRRPITAAYFAVGNKIACPDCIARIRAPLPGSPILRVLKATLMGLGVGLLGAAVWFAVRYFGHLEIGLIAIAVGYMVGKAVRMGSGNRGGRGYQILAVALTYLCISLNYAPDIVIGLVHEMQDRQSSASDGSAQPDSSAQPDGQQKLTAGQIASAVAIVSGPIVLTCLRAPFIGGAQNFLGLLIIAFGLLQAWRLNVGRTRVISGPYQLGSGGPLSRGALAVRPLPGRGVNS